ncbi:MAG: PhoH family protein [Spirochaetales bacterium]|nr:MAG: PhoH family protein [Spirochaetales bacterium]
MGNGLTIVLEDEKILGRLCGVNDENLKAIEQLLEERVYSRGNEVCIESPDEGKQSLFRLIINQLKDHSSSGYLPNPGFIHALFNAKTLKNTEKYDLLKNYTITIPGSSAYVYPKNLHQALYVKGMEEHAVAFSVGPAGTGKTYLSVAHALKEILTRQRRKLILTRPVVEAGESLGFLPGDLIQKISPYLRPLYDAMEALVPFDVINRLEESRTLEIAPLAYMRGRSFQDSYVILDEAQNTTKEQMKMFLTRLGEGSKVVITGDITQIDLPNKKHSGLLHAVSLLQSIEDLHFSFFDPQDVVRNPLVQKIIHAYDAENE